MACGKEGIRVSPVRICPSFQSYGAHSHQFYLLVLSLCRLTCTHLQGMWAWVRKSPWRMKWQPTPLFLLEKVRRVTKSRTRLSKLNNNSNKTECKETFLFLCCEVSILNFLNGNKNYTSMIINHSPEPTQAFL